MGSANWYKIDNVAKIFLATVSKRDTRSFRLSCTLNEKIHAGLLQKAVLSAIQVRPQVQVRIRRGIFWHYMEQIDDLRSAGFPFVLDDYGSGYSNLTRVKHYPFIDIKLDMEVVWDYFKTRDSLLPHVVTAFKELGFTVTAEGIETREMAEILKGIGCDYLQGYYFSRPVPMSEFLVMDI